MLGDFLSDPILSESPDLTLSIYGDKHQFRTAKLSSLHLHLAEGHVLGQVTGWVGSGLKILQKAYMYLTMIEGEKLKKPS